ncbi:cytochrome P450 84A1-like [Cucumis melo var. makuwa]|uniref:Cytochrome P450 84A1-like n=2 Tax=Cucumis melo TaxID=3656 RepID=A0A5D3CYW4_CUCMM|nr:cytochrome P450 84A1-like [Cucumis melo var. makuwa]
MDFVLQSFPISTFLFFILPLVFLLHASIFRRPRRPPLPPGPKGLPLLGNMLLRHQLTHRGLAALAKRYGGIFHLRIGFVHMVVISDPDAARNVLQVQDLVFSNRPATNAIKYLTYDRADMAFAHYGPFWRQMRKLCVMKLFSRKRAESWTSVRHEVDNLITTIANNTQTPFNLGHLVFSMTMNIIYRAAFGTSQPRDQAQFIKILEEFSKLFGAFNVADFFPCLGWIDPQGITSRLVEARRSLDRFIDRIIDQHLVERKERDQEIDKDMVDELLAFYSEDEGGNNETDLEDLHLQTTIKLTRDNIKAIIMDVMFGGTETVASAIEWTMAELMRNPDDLKKLQQQLDATVGLHHRPQESDLHNLTYLRCILKETLRLHPPIPLLLHETAADTKLAGYRIPAKSRVFINAWAIGRDEKSWVDPDIFRPARFEMEGAADFKGGDFEFIPFGSGRRSCPGMQLGIYAVEMAVANLVHCFEWKLPEGMKPAELDMNDVFGLTAPRASRLVAVPYQRVV